MTRSADTTSRPGTLVLNTMCLEDDSDGGDICGEGAGAFLVLLDSTGTSEFA